jgi:circadian clock protein KaiC
VGRNGIRPRAVAKKAKAPSRSAAPAPPGIEKALTGIHGLDEVTGGGLPRGRTTLVCGGPGSGKTLFALEFLIQGATQFGEPGVFLAFEETAEELAQNVRSLGFDLDDLIARHQIAVDYVHIDRSEIEETGEYDLEGLFIRLGWALDSIGAKRLAIDTIETIFSGFSNPALLRAELRRLFRWLKDRGVTAVITGERGEGALTRQGLEEYVSDCVILLDHRLSNQVATRRLRVVKYRGTSHGTNEYPFIIDEHGFEVLPVTSLGLEHEVSVERISTGIERLDAMLGGEGIYRGSSALVSGTAGSGKTSMAASFALACAQHGERCLYFAFEESPEQIVRNMRSIGIDLRAPLDRGLLRFHAARPTLYGLEAHLTSMHRAIREFAPTAVIVDPISNLDAVGAASEVAAMLMRLVDWLKSRQITALFTSLESGTKAEGSAMGVSSLIDTWFLVRSIEVNGERNRGLYVLKSRGMAHSNQIREFLITDRGVELQDVYLGPGGVLTGSARAAQEAHEHAADQTRRDQIEARLRALEVRRRAVEAQMATLRAEIEENETESLRLEAEETARKDQRNTERARMARLRQADEQPAPATARPRARR